jgi:HNH endonuclease
MKIPAGFTIDDLRKAFIYEADSGLLWRIDDSPWAERRMPSGSLEKEGYLDVCLRGRLIKAHCVAWALHYWSWPDRPIDHINGIRIDNSIGNLRLADEAKNGWNRGRQRNNRSGAKGVDWVPRSGKWRAQICCRGRRESSHHDTFDEAVAAYDAACRRLHGDFAKPNR